LSYNLLTPITFRSRDGRKQMSRPTVILTGKVVEFKKGLNETTQRHWSYIDILAPGETSIIRVFQIPGEYELQKGKYTTFAAVASVKNGNLSFGYKAEIQITENKIDLVEENGLETKVAVGTGKVK
jgi:hypothetical protein